MTRKSKARRVQKRKFYRLNQQIQVRELRLLDSLGKQIGIVPKEEALKKAQELRLDLVEIAPRANPPVAKLIDFKKFLYFEEKKRRLERKKTHIAGTKEVRFGPFTSGHDLTVRVERAKEFLKEGHKVKIVVKFTGRQMAHPEFGRKTLGAFLEKIAGFLKIEREPHFEGRLLVTLVSPIKGESVLPKSGEGKKVVQ